MSKPSCSEVCEEVMLRLNNLGHVFSDDEDHTDILDALGEVTVVPELTEADRHIIGLALIALLYEHEGDANTEELYRNIKNAATKLGVYDGLLEAAVEPRIGAPG